MHLPKDFEMKKLVSAPFDTVQDIGTPEAVIGTFNDALESPHPHFNVNATGDLRRSERLTNLM